MKAIDALGEIGDERAVSALIPFLGEEGETDFGGELGRTEGGRFCDHAARALRRLGQGGLTEAFSQILEGNQEALETLTGEHRAAVVQGLIRALDSPSVRRAVHAAGALAALGAVEALPALRSKAQRRRFAEEQARSLWARAVAHLEILAALPRPAEAEATDIGTLPRPALGTEGGL
jgi:HEAT repeat protein